MAPMQRNMSATVIAALLTLAACGDGESGATTTAAPFPRVPADAVVVSGSAACEVSDEGLDPEGGPGYLVVCELDLSDPRVSGTERHDRFHFVTERGGGTVWLAEDAVITNADGTWRGSVQAAEDARATPAGEAHYVGDGAYEGLEFHYYFFHADLAVPAEVRGWVSDGP